VPHTRIHRKYRNAWCSSRGSTPAAAHGVGVDRVVYSSSIRLLLLHFRLTPGGTTRQRMPADATSHRTEDVVWLIPRRHSCGRYDSGAAVTCPGTRFPDRACWVQPHNGWQDALNAHRHIEEDRKYLSATKMGRLAMDCSEWLYMQRRETGRHKVVKAL
jgi:hypothetical protein